MVVLTMVFLGIDNRANLPKVSYSTALDYYVEICFAFVLATIIQVCVIISFVMVENLFGANSSTYRSVPFYSLNYLDKDTAFDFFDKSPSLPRSYEEKSADK